MSAEPLPSWIPVCEARRATRFSDGARESKQELIRQRTYSEVNLTPFLANLTPFLRHPYRVMCRHESNLASYHVFLTYADGRYVFDSGDMSGTGVPTPRFVHGKPVTSAE